MRIQDDLHESTSSFYAELKRLKVIIDAVEAHKAQSGTSLPVFFLLDENSERHQLPRPPYRLARP
jgi:hypothetical protein